MNLDQLLNDNYLYRKQIPKGSNSLFKAISDALYFSTSQNQQISIMLVQYLDKLIQADVLIKIYIIQQLIPLSLSIFKTNQALKQDYSKQPNFPGFDTINLQLVSMMLRVKVTLYFVQDNRLTCQTFNNNYIRMIELCRDENNHYDSVYNQEFISNATLVQQVVYDLINKVTDNKNGFIPKTFKNIEMDNWINDKVTLIPQNKRNRSNSEQKNPLKSAPSKQIAIEVETLKNKEQEIEKRNTFTSFEQVIDQINNFKNNPPGLEINNCQSETPNKKPQVLEESEERLTGRLKFFDEAKSYGFIVLDRDNQDIFVHLDDLQKAGITKDYLRNLGSYFRSSTQVNHYGKGPNKAPQFSFYMMTYMGKYNRSRKAVDLKLIPE